MRTGFQPRRKVLAGSALPNAFRVSRGVALACAVVLATVLAMAGAAPALAAPACGATFSDPWIESTSLPSGTAGAPYNQDVQLLGTLPPFTLSVVSGSLPPGLSFNGNNILFTVPITGTPTTPGTYNFVLEISDIIGLACDRPLSIAIKRRPAGQP